MQILPGSTFIPDPKLEPHSCYKALTTHCEILTGASEFIKHSDNPDKYNSLYNSYVCNDLIRLLPQRVQFENPLFRNTQDAASKNSKSNYTAWEQWVTNAMQSLTEMDADSRSTSVATFSATKSVEPVLLADSHSAPPKQPGYDAALTKLIGRLDSFIDIQKAAGGGRPTRQTSGGSPALPAGTTSDPPTSCRYCITLAKSDLTASTVYSDIKAMNFKGSHNPYYSRYTSTYRIHPDNCLQWLNNSVKNRISALNTSKAQQICQVCLSIPVSWNKARTACEAAHSLRRRVTDKHIPQLCIEPVCPYHYKVCPTHTEQNKAIGSLPSLQQIQH